MPHSLTAIMQSCCAIASTPTYLSTPILLKLMEHYAGKKCQVSAMSVAGGFKARVNTVGMRTIHGLSICRIWLVHINSLFNAHGKPG